MVRKNIPVILVIVGVIIAIIIAMALARGGSEAARTTQPAAVTSAIEAPASASADRVDSPSG